MGGGSAKVNIPELKINTQTSIIEVWVFFITQKRIKPLALPHPNW